MLPPMNPDDIAHAEKQCTKCGDIKPLTSFFRFPFPRIGRRPHCKTCHGRWQSVETRRWASRVRSLRLRGEPPSLVALRERLGDPVVCYLCGDSLDWTTAQIDHRQPPCRGGSNDLVNLEWAHRRCNRQKSSLTYDELITWCERVLAHAARREELP